MTTPAHILFKQWHIVDTFASPQYIVFFWITNATILTINETVEIEVFIAENDFEDENVRENIWRFVASFSIDLGDKLMSVDC